ncbi:MoaD/ThiS family protein [uncultured Nocardioides sp.]|uniref:MoaD/ThiS family protein n=1 Tax=uncultured Nocardioides sp. TaxID=198441 RepID=UPI00262D349D|nr:MoaD/ThiS family protein [uncultured Nocardioides sp.]
MTSTSTSADRDAAHGGVVTPGVIAVHLWAAARAAAGTARADLSVEGPLSLAEVTAAVLGEHGGDARLQQVLGVCSVLVDDRPTGTTDHAEVVVRPGQAVQYLPPFAGG